MNHAPHAGVASAAPGRVRPNARAAAMTMSPTPLDRGYQGAISRLLSVMHRHGVPKWFGYTQLEFSANIVMFVPLGFLVGLLVARRLLWMPLLVVPVLSATIEILQGLLLSQRFASVLDVLANTMGGYMGLALVVVLRLFMEGRDRKIIARALWHRDVVRRRPPSQPTPAGLARTETIKTEYR